MNLLQDNDHQKKSKKAKKVVAKNVKSIKRIDPKLRKQRQNPLEKLKKIIKEKEEITLNPVKRVKNIKSIKKIDPKLRNQRQNQLEKLKKIIKEKEEITLNPTKKVKKVLSLRERMMLRLKAARFRHLNEQIYTTTSSEAAKMFKSDPEAFKAYHEGYKLQVKRWPVNPLNQIIKALNKMNKNFVVADFGCGEANLAKSVDQKVHSFDLVAANDSVTSCDMAHVPLKASSIDVAVFCLSLMGTNLKDYLLEANRVLKTGGIMKIAEVESRFENVEDFVKSCEKFGFKMTWMDRSYDLFYFMDFKKENNVVKGKKKLPDISLQPCLYKKR